MKKIIILTVVFSLVLLFIGCNNDPPSGRTFSVTYQCQAQGSSGYPPIDNNKYQSGSQATVLGRNSLVLAGHTFDGWNTRANGSGESYKEGEKIVVNSGVFLYAMWEKD